jgi:hypothetical protein
MLWDKLVLIDNSLLIFQLNYNQVKANLNKKISIY